MNAFSMLPWRIEFRSSALLAAVVAATFMGSFPMKAQVQPPATDHQPHSQLTASPLDTTLARLDANIGEFNQAIPGLVAREEVVSSQEPGPDGNAPLRTHTSSTFVVRRADDPNDPDDPAKDPQDPTQANPLHESRDIRVIDEKSSIKPKDESEKHTTASRMDSPYVVFGVFSGGLTRISTAGKACFRYRYHPARAGRDSSGRIVIDFASWPRKDRGADCPYADRITGHGFIDPVSMRLVRLEDTEIDDKGTWTWSIEYAPITVAATQLWLPTIISSENVSSSYPTGPLQKEPIQQTESHKLIARYSQYRQVKHSPAATSP